MSLLVSNLLQTATIMYQHAEPIQSRLWKFVNRKEKKSGEAKVVNLSALLQEGKEEEQ